MKTRLKVRSGRVSDPRLTHCPRASVLKCSRRRQIWLWRCLKHPLAHPLSHAALCTVRAPDDEEYGEEEDFDDDEVPPAACHPPFCFLRLKDERSSLCR